MVYCEFHHIKPRSIYPELENDPANIVALTAREHYIAHHLLMHWYKEEYGEDSKQYRMMLTAFWYISNTRNIRINARSYEILRIEFSKIQSIRNSGENNPMFGKRLKDCMSEEQWQRWLITNREAHASDKISDETKQKRSKSLTGENNPMFGITPKDRMDSETYDLWLLHQSTCRQGEKNPMFGKSSWEKASPEKVADRKARFGAKMKGRKRMYDPITLKNYFVAADEVQEYLDKGFKFGQINKKTKNLKWYNLLYK